MRHINGVQVGRWSLRLDAVYCAVLGIAVLITAPALAPAVALPAIVIGGVGMAVVLWAAVVLWMLVRLHLRSALRLVMAANMIAAIGVATVSSVAATTFVAIAVLAIAVDIALFAASQAVALRSLPSAAAN